MTEGPKQCWVKRSSGTWDPATKEDPVANPADSTTPLRKQNLKRGSGPEAS